MYNLQCCCEGPKNVCFRVSQGVPFLLDGHFGLSAIRHHCLLLDLLIFVDVDDGGQRLLGLEEVFTGRPDPMVSRGGLVAPVVAVVLGVGRSAAIVRVGHLHRHAPSQNGSHVRLALFLLVSNALLSLGDLLQGDACKRNRIRQAVESNYWWGAHTGATS